jgi:dihydrofolate synthase/folylpolyglutamate synthase
MDIDSLLQPFQRFGVHLGLERIHRLLADLGNPHHRVPIIHVAGTNGKGSVCAYLSAILTEAGYRVGRYTSPHLVDWNERICLNEQPISWEVFVELLQQVKAAIPEDTEDSPTQFEVITAAAWLYFTNASADIAVIEVGLGGRLDATNVSDSPLVSVITSISREHWQVLGPTLADIAREKAGILKSQCPAVIGQLPPEAETVVKQRIQELECPAIWVQPAEILKTQNSRRGVSNAEGVLPSGLPFQLQTMPSRWASYQGIEYPLRLEGDVQRMNSAIALASVQILQSQGWNISEAAIVSGMAKTTWPGRLQWITWRDRPLLIDGAHNPAAAVALRQYVDTLNTPVSWVMGILSTKDHADIFQALLRPCDRLYLVPVPDHSSANPEALATLAQTICPELTECFTYPHLEAGLEAATASPTETSEHLVVLCGSLYLVGYFLKTNVMTSG